jgi:pimeloyl-ACP methyl ester carboxylesterase
VHNRNASGAGYFRSGMPYVRVGSGPNPLVILQGLMFENKPQRGMTAGYGFLGRSHTVYSVLRRPGMAHGYTLADMAADYADTIRSEFGAPVDVIGVSTGGAIAQHLAADHPAQVRRLVIHSSAHTLSEKAKQLQLEVGRLAREGEVRRAAEVLVRFLLPKRGVWRMIGGPAVWVGSRLISAGVSGDLSDLIITIEAEDRHSFCDRLDQITAPTLVIAGSADPFYTPLLFEETAHGIPGARLVLYEGMRHPAWGRRFQRQVSAFLGGG